jgi:TPR repeat protein
VSAQTFRSGSGQAYAPTRPDDVLVFYSVEDIKQSHEIIGEITTAGSSGWLHNEGDLIKKARKAAARLGANAIVVRSIDKGSSGDRAMAVLFGSNDKTGRVTAIRFTTAPEAAAQGESTPDLIFKCNGGDDAACVRLVPVLQVACEDDAAMCMPLGFLYRNGRGVPLDTERATTLYTRACDAGQTKACSVLAEMRDDVHKQ